MRHLKALIVPVGTKIPRGNIVRSKCVMSRNRIITGGAAEIERGPQ